MYRKTVVWAQPVHDIRMRTGAAAAQSTPSRGAAEPARPSFPAAQAPAAAGTDLQPLLESLNAAVAELEQRRQQSLGELQQLALELSIAVSSHLVFQAIAREDYAVEDLVRQSIERLGLAESPTVSLHPADLELLHKRVGPTKLPWNAEQVQLRADPSVARGGCRVESGEGRMFVSDLTSRLSEIRRHWMEELDDAQIERRGAQGQGQSMRRFPDRREIA